MATSMPLSAWADEMHNFYEEEDLEYTYMEGSTPSLDQASLEGFTGENDGLMLMTKSKDTGHGAGTVSVGIGGGVAGGVAGRSIGTQGGLPSGSQGWLVIKTIPIIISFKPHPAVQVVYVCPCSTHIFFQTHTVLVNIITILHTCT